MSKNNKASNYNEKMLTRLRIQFIVLSMAVVIIMQGFIVYTSVICIIPSSSKRVWSPPHCLTISDMEALACSG